MRKKETGGQLFVKNAAILTVTSLLLRAVGMYFRIYVSALIGAEGIGLYQLILSVYVLVSGFASSGIVVAVTRMTADELACGSKRGLRLVLRRCLTVSMAMGLISAVLCASLAEPIGSGWISDPRSVMSVRVMALALPFMSISCCLRGYFTARRRVGIPSVAQMVEQGTRILLAVVLLRVMLPMGVAYACMAIMIADVVSEGLGCIYCMVGYLLDRRRQCCPDESRSRPPAGVGSQIWAIAAPITASHYLTTLLRTIESILVPDCLTRSLLSRTQALEMFGMVKGMALPLILFPSTLLTAFSSLLVPEISRAQALGKTARVDEAVCRSMHITLTLAIPAAALFALYPYELGMLIYNEPELAMTLRVLAPLMPLMYIESVITGILRGLGEQNASLRYGILDSVVRIVLIVVLVPRLGMTGFLAVMVVSNLLTPLLHLRRLMRVTLVRFDYLGWLAKPLGAMAAACLIAWLTGELPIVAALPMLCRVGIGSVLALGIYAAMLYALGGVRRRDFATAWG